MTLPLPWLFLQVPVASGWHMVQGSVILRGHHAKHQAFCSHQAFGLGREREQWIRGGTA